MVTLLVISPPRFIHCMLHAIIYKYYKYVYTRTMCYRYYIYNCNLCYKHDEYFIINLFFTNGLLLYLWSFCYLSIDLIIFSCVIFIVLLIFCVKMFNFKLTSTAQVAFVTLSLCFQFT